jgi:hypothetical protein
MRRRLGVGRESDPVITWGRVPWTLWLWAVGILASSVVFVVVVHHHSGWDHIVTVIMTLAILSLWPYFMFRGVRWLWIATVGFDALVLVIDLATGSGTWYGDLGGLVQLGLLLLPVTRRFFSSDSAATATS